MYICHFIELKRIAYFTVLRKIRYLFLFLLEISSSHILLFVQGCSLPVFHPLIGCPTARSLR